MAWLLILRLSPWLWTRFDQRYFLVLLHGLLNKCLWLLEFVNHSLAGRWDVRLDLVLGLRVDKVNSVFVEVLEFIMNELDLSIGEGITTSVDESFDCSELVNINHVDIPLEINRVKILLDHALVNERRVSLIQLDFQN